MIKCFLLLLLSNSVAPGLSLSLSLSLSLRRSIYLHSLYHHSPCATLFSSEGLSLQCALMSKVRVNFAAYNAGMVLAKSLYQEVRSQDIVYIFQKLMLEVF